MVRDWGHDKDTVILTLEPAQPSHCLGRGGAGHPVRRRDGLERPAGRHEAARLDSGNRGDLCHGRSDPRHGYPRRSAGPRVGSAGQGPDLLHGRCADPTGHGGSLPETGHQAAERLRHDGELVPSIHLSRRRPDNDLRNLRTRRPQLHREAIQAGKPGRGSRARRGRPDRRQGRLPDARLFRQSDGDRGLLQSGRLVPVG